MALPSSDERPGLKRTLTVWHAVLYGLGVTIGAGIYVLVGLAAGRSGLYAPLAFLIAAVLLSFSAASFAELGTRMPVSASEAAYVAAAYQYHFYITNDDFSAGYLWRDLEVLVCGVEAAAQSLSDMRKKASDAGGKRSAKARELRRADLMDELERVAERNPEISALGPELVSRVALKNCISRNLSIWRQGKGQIEEYLGELRRGEAGPEMQSRFLALFPAKPPKR